MKTKTKQTKSFWNSKTQKCLNCGVLNMEHTIKIYGVCGNCGNKINTDKKLK